MADLLRRELGVEVELVRGGRGIFDVRVAGRTVAAKSAGQFPDPDACLRAVREALAAGNPDDG